MNLSEKKNSIAEQIKIKEIQAATHTLSTLVNLGFSKIRRNIKNETSLDAKLFLGIIPLEMVISDMMKLLIAQESRFFTHFQGLILKFSLVGL